MIKKFKNFKGEPEVKIDYYPNGQKRYEVWYLIGKKQRKDGPASQCWYENGQIKYEFWYFNDKLHREDGHAIQTWHENGQKHIEDWYLNGKRHREDGPAYQNLFKNGQIWIQSWYLNDEQYSRVEWIEQLKKIGSKHYKEQKMLFDIEKYNL